MKSLFLTVRTSNPDGCNAFSPTLPGSGAVYLKESSALMSKRYHRL